jgi:hypothetical protein
MTGTTHAVEDLSFQSEFPSGQQALINAADTAERQCLEEQAALSATIMASIAELNAKIAELRSNLPKGDVASPDIPSSDPVMARKDAIPSSIGPDLIPSLSSDIPPCAKFAGVRFFLR